MNAREAQRRLEQTSALDVRCPRCRADIGQGCQGLEPHKSRELALERLRDELRRLVVWERGVDSRTGLGLGDEPGRSQDMA